MHNNASRHCIPASLPCLAQHAMRGHRWPEDSEASIQDCSCRLEGDAGVLAGYWRWQACSTHGYCNDRRLLTSILWGSGRLMSSLQSCTTGQYHNYVICLELQCLSCTPFRVGKIRCFVRTLLISFVLSIGVSPSSPGYTCSTRCALLLLWLHFDLPSRT